MTQNQRKNYVADIRREYFIENAEVVGFCKLTNLIRGKYGFNYQLTVMIDEELAQEIKEFKNKAFAELEDKYHRMPQEFNKIGTRLSDVRPSEVKKPEDDFICPRGKKLLCLNMDAQRHKEGDGRTVYIYDTDNNPITSIDIRQGSILNVQFSIRSYNVPRIGLMVFLGSVQVVDLVGAQIKCPFQKMKDGFKAKNNPSPTNYNSTSLAISPSYECQNEDEYSTDAKLQEDGEEWV